MKAILFITSAAWRRGYAPGARRRYAPLTEYSQRLGEGMHICIARVPHYRIYLIDELGKIFHGEDADAPSDAVAIAAGGHLLETHNASRQDIAYRVEIWRGKSRIF